MAELGEDSQSIFTQPRAVQAAYLIQACAVHHLTTKLPVTFMSELTFQQVMVHGIYCSCVWICTSS